MNAGEDVGGGGSRQGTEETLDERALADLSAQGELTGRSAGEWAAACRRAVNRLLAREPLPGSKEPPGVLLEAIVHRSLDPGRAAIRAALLGALLDELAGKEDLNRKIAALRLLALLGSEESVAPLAEMLRSADVPLREYALRALDANPSKAAARALIALLEKSESEADRVALASALGRRREAAAVPALAALAVGQGETAAAALDALGGIGSAEAARALGEALARGPDGLRASAEAASLACGWRLLDAGRKEAAAELFAGLRDRTGIPLHREAALRGLALAGSP